MTELEQWTPPIAVNELTEWTDNFMATAAVSAQLARTAFVPASLRIFRDNGRTYDPEGTAAQVTAAILTGRELRLSPMGSLRSIDIIQGTPALRAIALRGVLLAAGHDIWVEEATNHRATVAGRRRGSEQIQRITWSMDDAKSRNLSGKPNWRSQPRNMLIARATADVARLVAADALLGVPYTAEELEDGDQDALPPGSGPVQAAEPRKARRAAPAAPDAVKVARQILKMMQPGGTRVEDEPSLDGDASIPVTKPETATTEPDEPTLDLEPDPPEPDTGITDPQMRKMQALFHEQNFVDREDRIAYVEQTIGRTVTSSSELSVGEASAVIDALTMLPAVQP